MIRPEHDDRLVAVWACLQSVQYSSQHRIGVMNRGEISLNRTFPLPLFLNVLEITIRSTTFSLGRQIFQVVDAVARWNLNFVEGKGFKVFCGDKPRFVRSVNTTCQKEGPIMLLLKLLGHPLGHQIVTPVFFVRDIDRPPIRFDVLPGSGSWQIQWAIGWIVGSWERIFRLRRGKILIPRRSINEVMEHLA